MIATDAVTPILQLAVSPVILISAVGLLLLTLNNRMAASINRVRLLVRESDTALGDTKKKMEFEIDIIYKRAQFIRRAIVYIIGSALSSAFLIISIFIATLFGFEVAWLYIGCFIISLMCLIVGLVYFIRDVNDGLVALRMEIGERE
jgi:hypothetical protein